MLKKLLEIQTRGDGPGICVLCWGPALLGGNLLGGKCYDICMYVQTFYTLQWSILNIIESILYIT